MSEVDSIPRPLAETVGRASTRHPGIRYPHIYGAVLRGELRAERVGGRWMLTDKQLERYLAGEKA
jgi:hypothetical protein